MTFKQNWPKEPWRWIRKADSLSDTHVMVDCEDEVIFEDGSACGEYPADLEGLDNPVARRIEACVNFCIGISTEALEEARRCRVHSIKPDETKVDFRPSGKEKMGL